MMAQREVEQAALRSNVSQPAVDFSHLLELVKEFGEELDACEDVDDSCAEGSISISTPRGKASMRADLESEIHRVRAELADSRKEVAELRAAISERDRQLTACR